MSLKRRLTKLVEKKLAGVMETDLTERIKNGNRFDTESYADELFFRYFPDEESENLKNEIMGSESLTNSSFFISNGSTETYDYSQRLLEFDVREFYNFSTEEITANLQSNNSEIRVHCLKEIEICAEDLINQPYWDFIKKILQSFLEKKTDRKTQILTLKIFQKFLLCSKKPQIVCEAFLCLAETVMIHLDILNSIQQLYSTDNFNDFKNNEINYNHPFEGIVFYAKKEFQKQNVSIDSEVLLKSMSLLIKCQKQMPAKWIRFNGNRLKEIIFAFVQLLSSTTNPKFNELSGFELLSILNPKGNWCRHWCHTATGRRLFCSALKKHKNLFTYIIEIILTNIKKKKVNCLLPSISSLSLRDISHKYESKNLDTLYVNRDFLIDRKNRNNNKYHLIRSAPASQTTENSKKIEKSMSEYSIKYVPKHLVERAVFCHSFSLVVFLMQYRGGRSLFPVKTPLSKRLISVQELVTSMTNHIQNLEEDFKTVQQTITPAYREHMSNLLEILKNIQTSLYKKTSSASKMS